MSRLFFLLLIFSLIFITPTNADFNDRKIIKSNKLKASTLDFSQTKTTNDSHLETLFDIQGMVAGGYQVASLRIENYGEIKPSFLITFSKNLGNDNLCRNLEIEFLKNNQSIYKSDLIDLDFKVDLDQNNKSVDFLIFLKLKNNFINSQAELCNFNLNISGLSSSNSGFKYQSKIQNYISIE